MSLNIKKAIGASFFALILTAMFIGFVPTAQAVTREEQLVQIQTLLKMIEQLQAQLAQLQGKSTSSTQCIQLTRNLYLGVKDANTAGEVSKLQRFLTSTGHYTYGEITGYYGPTTQRAVQAWQTANGVVSSGSPETTGFGAVGPLTRSVITRSCSVSTQIVTPIIQNDNISVTIASISNSENPTVKGTAYGIDEVGFSVSNGDKVYGSGDIKVEDNEWSHKITKDFDDGTYTLTVYVDNNKVAQKTFVIDLNFPDIVVDESKIIIDDTSNLITTSPATLKQYWSGKAEWEIDNKLIYNKLVAEKWPPGYGEGSQIVVGKDGVWYLFHRHVYNALETESMESLWGAGTETERKKCGFGGSIIGTDVRKSTDKGLSWSDPRPIVWPAKGSPWECMGGDGGAYYDTTSNTWKYLFQCLALTPDRTTLGKWNGCLITFDGADPVIGPDILWDVAPGAVVIQSGSLLNKLCADADSTCARLHTILPETLKDVSEEGTFDIFDKKFVGGKWWWYVTMHGFDGVLGYRGLAKTTDFVNWKIGSDASDLPNDFIGSAYTPGGWDETWQGWTDGSGNSILTEPWTIGTGGARILKEGEYYYEIIEASDKNLVCVPGQNWDIGMLRTNNLANATWEQYPFGNPIFRSADIAPGLPCSISYPNIFRDTDGTIYLHQHISSTNKSRDGIYIYRLISK